MDPFSLARRVTASGMRTVEVVLDAPDQLAALWRDVHELVGGAQRLLGRLEDLAGRAEDRLAELDGLLVEGDRVLTDASGVADQARDVAVAVGGTRELAEAQVLRIRALLDLYLPTLEALVPLGREAAGLLRPIHLRGLARLLDELPGLVDRLEPALDGMGTMTPHLEEMTERMDTVGQVVEGLPGAKLLKRRGQAREEQDEI